MQVDFSLKADCCIIRIDFTSLNGAQVFSILQFLSPWQMDRQIVYIFTLSYTKTILATMWLLYLWYLINKLIHA